MKRRNLAARLIYWTFNWSRAFFPVIAFFASVASSVRTMQTTAEIYQRSGTPYLGTIAVALAFTIAVEGCIFIGSLAQEWQHIKWRTARKKRRVFSLLSIWRSVLVRIGSREPLSYDQMPEGNTWLTVVLVIAFIYAITSNFNMGIRPLIEQMGSNSLQAFISGLVSANAQIQTAFIVDTASVLFPPFMALAAGHLTARFASEIVTSMNRAGGGKETPSRPAPALPKPKSERKRGTSERAIKHLNEHPEDAQLSNRALAKKLNVSVGTANAVLKSVRSTERSIERPMNENGRSHDDEG